MKRKIIKENPNGQIIMKLYQLCSSELDQMQALFDEDLKIQKISDKSYHFTYLDTEFDFSKYKIRKEIKDNERWILLASKKFLESYKLVKKYWEEGTFLIIGYVNSVEDGKKVLNSWIEQEIDDVTYIKDINRNLIMKKCDYDKIFMPIELNREYKEKENKFVQK